MLALHTWAQHFAMRRRSGSGVDASIVGRAALIATCTMICPRPQNPNSPSHILFPHCNNHSPYTPPVSCMYTCISERSLHGLSQDVCDRKSTVGCPMDSPSSHIFDMGMLCSLWHRTDAADLESVGEVAPGGPSGGALIEDSAQRKDIHLLVAVGARKLLWRHVLGRSIHIRGRQEGLCRVLQCRKEITPQ